MLINMYLNTQTHTYMTYYTLKPIKYNNETEQYGWKTYKKLRYQGGTSTKNTALLWSIADVIAYKAMKSFSNRKDNRMHTDIANLFTWHCGFSLRLPIYSIIQPNSFALPMQMTRLPVRLIYLFVIIASFVWDVKINFLWSQVHALAVQIYINGHYLYSNL